MCEFYWFTSIISPNLTASQSRLLGNPSYSCKFPLPSASSPAYQSTSFHFIALKRFLKNWWHTIMKTGSEKTKPVFAFLVYFFRTTLFSLLDCSRFIMCTFSLFCGKSNTFFWFVNYKRGFFCQNAPFFSLKYLFMQDFGLTRHPWSFWRVKWRISQFALTSSPRWLFLR